MEDKTLQSGEYKHGNSWETQLVITHLQHAIGHIQARIDGLMWDNGKKGGETSLSHARARIGMADELDLREWELEKREARRGARKQKAVTTG